MVWLIRILYKSGHPNAKPSFGSCSNHGAIKDLLLSYFWATFFKKVAQKNWSEKRCLLTIPMRHKFDVKLNNIFPRDSYLVLWKLIWIQNAIWVWTNALIMNNLEELSVASFYFVHYNQIWYKYVFHLSPYLFPL